MGESQHILAPDIAARVDGDFRVDERNEAKQVLARLHGECERESDRVLRCVVFLSEGSLQRLAHNAEQARQDYRDVIYWAEYDLNDNRLRDFNQPFKI